MKIDGRSLAELRDEAEVTVTIASAFAAGVLHAFAEDAPSDRVRWASPDEVAERAGLDGRAVAILLPALAESGLLEEEDGRYRPTDACRRTLCDPRSEDFAGGGLPLWLSNLEGWTRLPEVLRTGEPVRRAGTVRDEESLRRFMAGMAAAPSERVQRMVDRCLERAPHARRMLDVGGGPGHMARRFVEHGLRATLFDTPETVDFVRAEYGLADVEGLELARGDFNTDPLPDGPFDVVLLSNVIHIYGPDENRRLVAEAARVAAPGGVIALQDFLRGRSGRAARFALVMLMRTETGNTYSEDEVRAWLREEGLVEVRVEDLDPDRQLVTARKPPSGG